MFALLNAKLWSEVCTTNHWELSFYSQSVYHLFRYLFSMNNREYPPKILIAWGEAISGNKKIRDWLIQNGYKELGIFVYALHNKNDARQWLLDNGFPHLMALINGAEGNDQAISWLQQYGYDTLAKMAMTGDGSEEAYNWLKENDKIFAVIAHKIYIVKDWIDRDNNDIHKISPE